MKKLAIQAFLVVLACVFWHDSYAQKFGYIDSKFILGQMKEYKQAQSEIAQLSQGWQKEVDAKNKEVDNMEKAYLAEEVLLTDEMKKERLTAISKKREEAREYQKKIFGFEGLYFLKKQELIKPVQDKVFEAVEKVSKAKKIQIMFDKSGELVMIYTDPRHDYTDFVLEELGLGNKDDVIDNKR